MFLFTVINVITLSLRLVRQQQPPSAPTPNTRPYEALWPICLGVIMYVMLYGTPPFRGQNNEQTYELIQQGKVIFLHHKARLSVLARDLMLKLLVQDPTQRLSAEEALCHPWLSGTE